MELKTYIEFFTKLATFDWFYTYSDDHRTWTNGEKTLERLRTEAGSDDFKQLMFDRWAAYVNARIKGQTNAQQPELSDFRLA